MDRSTARIPTRRARIASFMGTLDARLHRARRPHRATVRRLRRARQRRSRQGRATDGARRLSRHFAAGDLSRPRHRRLRDRRQPRRRTRARHRARIRRAHRRAALVVGSDSGDRRRTATARLDADRRRGAPAPRTPGRSCRSMPAAAWCSCRPARASPDFFGGERPGDNSYANSLVALRADTGAGGLASPARASRRVGLRPRRAADADRHRARRQIDSGGRAGDEDRHAVRLRSRDRRAGVRDRRAARAADRMSPGEVTLADATVSRRRRRSSRRRRSRRRMPGA